MHPQSVAIGKQMRHLFPPAQRWKTKLLLRLDAAIEFHFGILTTWRLHHSGSDFNDISWNIVSSVFLSTSVE
jgi:hypothetical protein